MPTPIKKSLVFLTMALLIPIALPVLAGDLLSDLPDSIKAGNWKPDPEVLRAEGEDLFRLIDGGAEMYLRQGFVRAWLMVFQDGEGRTIDLQIFEMKDRQGSRLIYEKKAGAGGRDLAVGEAARLQDYYLNFRKGRYVVTLAGFDSSGETRRGLEALAEVVAEKLSQEQD